MQQNNIDVLISWKPANTAYISNFIAFIYSRPIITVLPLDQEPSLIVPALDEDHAKSESLIRDIRSYVEFTLEEEEEQKETDPFQILKNIIHEYGLETGTLGIEENFFSITSLKGLKKILAKAEFVDGGEIVDKLRIVKSKEEIEAVKRAAELADFGVSKSIEAAREGITEIELDTIGNNAVLERSSVEYPDYAVRFINMSPSGNSRSALVHVFSTSKKLEKGDFVVHTRLVSLHGYYGECERTFVVGEPTEKQKEVFEVVTKAQLAAIDAAEPGVSVSKLDDIARGIITDAGYGKYFLHRTGHGIGLEPHERPYLKEEDPTILEPGIIFSVEPAIYIPGICGVRHSDTVLITEDGHEVFTKYPKDLNSLTV